MIYRVYLHRLAIQHVLVNTDHGHKNSILVYTSAAGSAYVQGVSSQGAYNTMYLNYIESPVFMALV